MLDGNFGLNLKILPETPAGSFRCRAGDAGLEQYSHVIGRAPDRSFFRERERVGDATGLVNRRADTTLYVFEDVQVGLYFACRVAEFGIGRVCVFPVADGLFCFHA